MALDESIDGLEKVMQHLVRKYVTILVTG